MNIRYMRLSRKPGLGMHYPVCEACIIEVDYEDECWQCPSCGTQWPIEIMESDGDDAELYEEWSGEKLDGELVSTDDAYLFGKMNPEERGQRIKEYYSRYPDRKPQEES